VRRYINKFIVIFFISLVCGQKSNAEILIKSLKKNYSWKTEWTSVISDELRKDEYRVGDQAFLNLEIDEEDLDDLQCDGYNKANLDEKTDFWVVFFSSLVRAESAFNTNARSKMSRGHRSYGLLQLSIDTAKSRCGKLIGPKDILNPTYNLKCGIKLMHWQLLGAPISNKKKLRSDLEGQLFGKYMFQWGPLRQNDPRGRNLLVNWFTDHLDQLKFCQKR
jgi:hypothetical protein